MSSVNGKLLLKIRKYMEEKQLLVLIYPLDTVIHTLESVCIAKNHTFLF